jgi:hydrogenase-4 component E
MISQRRILSLINLFTAAGRGAGRGDVFVGYATQQPHLYVSGALTLVLKVILIPWMLHRMIRRSTCAGTSRR